MFGSRTRRELYETEIKLQQVRYKLHIIEQDNESIRQENLRLRDRLAAIHRIAAADTKGT